MAVTARRTLAKVKSSAIRPRQPEVPNLIGEEFMGLYSSPECWKKKEGRKGGSRRWRRTAPRERSGRAEEDADGYRKGKPTRAGDVRFHHGSAENRDACRTEAARSVCEHRARTSAIDLPVER